MANSPDPLANNPDIRKWAEQFYAINSWSLPDAGDDDTPALAGRRTKAARALSKITVGPAFTSGSRRAFAGGIKALSERIRIATEIDAFDSIDTDIDALDADIKKQALTAQARVKAEADLTLGEARFDAILDSLDQGARVFVEKKLKKAQSDFRTAKSKSDFESISSQIATFLSDCTDAEDYGKDFDDWAAATISLVTLATVEPALSAFPAARDACKVAALPFATAGDFAKARGELAKWHSQAGVADTVLAEAKAFEISYTAYKTTHSAACDAALNSAMTSPQDYKDYVSKAIELAYTDGNYVDAKTHVDDLVKWATDRKDLVTALAGITSTSKRFAPIRTALDDMDKEQKANRIPQAIHAITTLKSDHPDVLQENECFLLTTSYKKKVLGLLAVLKNPEKADVETKWKAFQKEIKKKNFSGPDGAISMLPKINELLRLNEIADQRDSIALLLAQPPVKSGYAYDADMISALASADYPAAVGHCRTALANLQTLETYLNLKKHAQALADSLSSPLKDDLVSGLTAAELKAVAKKPDEALSDLQGVLGRADYLGLSLEMTDYYAKKDKVEKRHNRALKYLKGTPGEGALVASFNTACGLAETKGKFGDAFLALDQHDKNTIAALSMGSAQYQITGIVIALKRLALAPPKDKELSDIERRINAADADAAASKFKQAGAAYDGILTDLQDLSKGAATVFETRDHVGCDAGHSVQRHGFETTDEKLIERLRSGAAPNSPDPTVKAYTSSSTRFESPQDWLAGREIAAQAASTLPPAERFNINDTSFAYDPAHPENSPDESREFIVDHGRPIDKGFVGNKRHLRPNNETNEPEPGKTYETYEEVSGLTRAKVGFVWVPDPIAAVPVPDDTDTPGPPVDFQPKSNKEYVQACGWKRVSVPSSIPGRWVMMQQFPVADGWDDDLKMYTNADPKGLIP